MAVFHFSCFILVGIVVIGDKLVVVFRLQDGLNVICLFIWRCFDVISSVVIDVNSLLEKLMTGSFENLLTLWSLSFDFRYKSFGIRLL